MDTSEYKWYKQPFDKFNEAQELAVPYLDTDSNLIICLNTAVGKSALAECAFAWHLQKGNGKCVFTAPLKSISSEKYEDWIDNDFFGQYETIVANGDNQTFDEEFDSARIIVATSETIDSKLRNYTPNDRWIDKIECFVIDEAHLINVEGRGAVVESILIRLSKINPNARFILLSATMDNGVDIAKWVKSLNGKTTNYIESDWRPTKVIPTFNVYENGSGYVSYNRKDKSQSWKKGLRQSEYNKIEETIRLLEQDYKVGLKTIIFVHSKNYGKSLGKAIQEKGFKCGFHNASVDKNSRKAMEKAFSDKYSKFDVLIATSTLSAGVNIG